VGRRIIEGEDELRPITFATFRRGQTAACLPTSVARLPLPGGGGCVRGPKASHVFPWPQRRSPLSRRTWASHSRRLTRPRSATGGVLDLVASDQGAGGGAEYLEENCDRRPESSAARGRDRRRHLPVQEQHRLPPGNSYGCHENFTCPTAGEETNLWERLTGILTAVPWSTGKEMILRAQGGCKGKVLQTAGARLRLGVLAVSQARIRPEGTLGGSRSRRPTHPVPGRSFKLPRGDEARTPRGPKRRGFP